MPWRGFEPRRLAAPPPQDGVSTSFTTRACEPRLRASAFGSRLRPTNRVPTNVSLYSDLSLKTGPTGLEPATPRVTVECSNQTELRPLTQIGARMAHLPPPIPISCTACHRGYRFPSVGRSDGQTVRPSIARTGVEPVSAP